ncbi:hypothetical protein HO133_008642 [Letharia lupina]|uniref:Dipeptidyl-peptidase V n=1 Tax=Letharia lupina TaxID=560253 RepID=A0A8H6CPH7_9LECA|nr:uncharacterized protein HO133_008642 [Letharia lupina]KAF6227200.1 hypothetical protein HO133_008642 [Letharia lupina]
MNDAAPTSGATNNIAPVSALSRDSARVVPTVDSQPTGLTPEALVDLECPGDVQLAPSGKNAVYCLRAASRRGDRVTSSLWIAEVGKEHSARQITSGDFNDELPRWSWDSKTIAFVSDRAEPGKCSAIYLLDQASLEPVPLTDPKKKKKISSLKWSPNDRYIAFLCPDEMTAKEDCKLAIGDDATVYNANWDYSRLRCIDVGTKTTLTLFEKASHVNEFAWNLKSDQIFYVLQPTPEYKSSALYQGVILEKVCLENGNATKLCTFPGPISSLTWSESSMYFLGGISPDKNNTVSGIYTIDENGQGWTALALDDSVDAVDLRLAATSLSVQVQKGLQDQILLLGCSSATVLYTKKFYNDISEIITWDILDLGEGNVVLVLGKGSPNCPTEIYSIWNQNVSQLSQHGQAITKLDIASAEVFNATADDNTELDGVLLLPSKRGRKPWPTVVIPHGGPHTRVTFGFDIPYFHWGPWLAAAGYAVLCPNYRGGSARGEKFASYGRGLLGTKDYSDIIAMVLSGIERGTFDRDRIGIGGWSQGGFLSYLSVTRPAFRFVAAVCGGGVTDWDMLTMSSDVPAVEEELAGGAPWNMEMDCLKTRHVSPVWHMKDIKTPILILHSEKDERVPVSQAFAFYRGCLHHKYRCDMVLYPREPHMVAERLHRIDMLKRIRHFYDSYLQ